MARPGHPTAAAPSRPRRFLFQRPVLQRPLPQRPVLQRPLLQHPVTGARCRSASCPPSSPLIGRLPDPTWPSARPAPATLPPGAPCHRPARDAEANCSPAPNVLLPMVHPRSPARCQPRSCGQAPFRCHTGPASSQTRLHGPIRHAAPHSVLPMPLSGPGPTTARASTGHPANLAPRRPRMPVLPAAAGTPTRPDRLHPCRPRRSPGQTPAASPRTPAPP